MKKLVFLCLIAGVAGWGCARRAPKEPRQDHPFVKVMTYNINYGLAGEPSTLKAIYQGRPDLVLLQETTQEWEDALRDEFGKMYPYMKFKHCCGAGGLGIMSRYPFEEKDYISSPSGWFPAWRIMVDSPIGKLQVLNVHLHPPVSESGSIVSGYFKTPKVRLEEIESFYEYLDLTFPTLIAGDFNEKKAGRAVKFLSKKGFRTVVPEFHGSAAPTWHWETSIGTITSQLDHIMYNDLLEPLNADVFDAGNSDHFPVIATFEPK